MLLIYEDTNFQFISGNPYFNISYDNKKCNYNNYNKNDTKNKKTIVPKKFTNERLEEFKNIEELFQYKSRGYYDTLKFEKCAEQNKDMYIVNFQITQENNKTYIRMYIYYPYLKEIAFIEIHDIYYDNKLYKRIAFDPKKVNHATIYKIMKDFEIDANFSYKAEKYSFDIQYEDKFYPHIKNNKSYNLIKYRYLCNKPISFTNIYTLQKYDLEILQNKYKVIKTEENIMKYNKKIEHPLIDYSCYEEIRAYNHYHYNNDYDIPLYSAYKYTVLESGNITIMEYSGEKGCFKRIINFFRGGKKRSISQVNNSNNEEEVIIDGETNKMLKVSIKGEEKNLYEIIGYKIAKIKYNEKYKMCIIEVKIPKDARIASDGYKKYRCDKLIPQEVYIADQGGIKKLNKDEIKGLYCESKVYSSDFKYYIDQICEEYEFNPNLNKVCTRGLHYCLSMTNAIDIFGGKEFDKNKLDIIEE